MLSAVTIGGAAVGTLIPSSVEGERIAPQVVREAER
jgi:hypothetical protein